MVYAAQPREGTETSRFSRRILPISYAWFMQLNPARGRKLSVSSTARAPDTNKGLCSSTPRGDGNFCPIASHLFGLSYGLCSSTPRGDGNMYSNLLLSIVLFQGLCSSTPRGDGNLGDSGSVPHKPSGLCSSTPRGDGNMDAARAIVPLGARFMQLNPARGRKHGRRTCNRATRR